MHDSSHTIRLFRSPVLELLSRTYPLIVSPAWFAVGVFVIYSIDWSAGPGLARLGLLLLLTILGWTLFEYLVHRYVFHFTPKSAVGRALMFIVHQNHHDYPQQKFRNMIPLIVSVPAALAFLLLFRLVLPEAEAMFCFGVFALSYAVYDLLHYMLHLTTWTIVAGLRQRHMIHHYVDETKNFGVTSGVWDLVLGTDFAKREERL